MVQNGRLTNRQLAPIFHPSLHVQLGAGDAAASWNTMRLYLMEKFGRSGDIYPEGPLGAYRDFAGQVKCKDLFGKNAATPGKSNHGLGRAVDVATHEMATLVDRHGAAFGWHHWDAKWEWWHREYDSGFSRPDPGPDQAKPVLRKGSGGPGQHGAVKKLQELLNANSATDIGTDGDFGDETRKALIAFQRSHGLPGTGVVGPKTWAALRQASGGAVATHSRSATTADGAVANGRLRGFDVSDARGDVGFARAHQAGLGFVSVRVADGDVRDVRYGPGRIAALRASGLAWFPYYFGRVASNHNGQRDGAAEAKMAIGFAKAGGWGRKGDLPLAYDFETPNGQPPRKCARHLIQFVRAYRADRGHYPILYTMPGFWNSVLPQLSANEQKVVARCPLWVANWDVPAPPALRPWGKKWALWQNSDHGTVRGVADKCDTDYFKGSQHDIAGTLLVS
jgi:lysozyme